MPKGGRIYMRKTILALIAVLVVFGVSACKPRQAVDAAHNSRNSVNWDGVYAGVVPAASAPGIDVRITLYPNETYEMRYEYIDREGSFTDSGSFAWDEAGSVIKLDGTDMPPYYKVGENVLIQLDMQGDEITGSLASAYILKKAQ
jgi:uncharacterized lipoprotein NlpE involved in copper resistance